MKSIISCLLIICVIGCTNNASKDDATVTTTDTTNKMSSDTSSADNMSAPVDSATMMKNWQAYATPGSPHAMMAKWNGTWKGKVIMWHSPGAPADTSDGTAINKMIYDGRYQLSTQHGNMMGMKFEGQSIMGYDNAKKVFQSTWIDNMGTGMMLMEGPWDEANKTITMTGKVVDPTASTLKEISMRHTVKIIDDNTHLYEMYCNGPDGKEFKTMELKMTRQ